MKAVMSGVERMEYGLLFSIPPRMPAFSPTLSVINPTTECIYRGVASPRCANQFMKKTARIPLKVGRRKVPTLL